MARGATRRIESKRVWFPLQSVDAIRTLPNGETLITWKSSSFEERHDYGGKVVAEFLESYHKKNGEQGRVVSKKVLYEKYETFEKIKGRLPLSKIMFGKIVQSDIRVRQPHINGERHWIFPPVELKK